MVIEADNEEARLEDFLGRANGSSVSESVHDAVEDDGKPFDPLYAPEPDTKRSWKNVGSAV